jgi:hypothetical protein
MVTESDRRDSACPRGISRRHFIKLATAAGLIAGCAPVPQPAPTWTGEPDVTTGVATATDTPAPTSSPTATATPMPTDTPAPTAIPAPTVHIRRPDIIKTYPDVPSKVVQAHHAGVWTGTPRGGRADNDLLVPEVLRQMLDTLIAELTGLHDGREAWAALFNPDERIAIKVNTLGFSGVAPFWTHVPLAMAVTECLQEAGVPAEQIFLYDITTSDLEGAGYSINRDGPGVRCYGTAESWRDRKKQGGRMYWDTNAFVRGWDLSGHEVGLSDILLHCDALINMPRLSDHSLSGITFAMKNHYGTFDSAAAFHVPETFRRAVVELNALPPIRDRTRLIVGDALVVVGWGEAVTGDSILMSFDPVATDTVALQLYLDAWPSGSEGLMPDSVVGRATPWLENAARLGLGTNDPDHMDLVEVNLV